MEETIRNEQVRGNVPRTSVRVSNKCRSKKKGLICDIHYHDEIELLCIHEGSFTAIVDNTEYTAGPGEIIFINSRVPHHTCSSSDEHVNSMLQFKENDFLSSEITKIIKYSARFKNLSNDNVRIICSSELFRLVEEVCEEFAKRDSAYEIYIKAGIFKILGFLYRNGILSDSEEMYNTKEVQKILPVLSHLNKHYEENMTLEEASAMLSFDPSYFCRIFKTATGATFTEYLNFVRICRAEKMLSVTEKSVLEISEQVGFSSVSYFNRIFKRYNNCSPRQYRAATYANI